MLGVSTGRLQARRHAKIPLSLNSIIDAINSFTSMSRGPRCSDSSPTQAEQPLHANEAALRGAPSKLQPSPHLAGMYGLGFWTVPSYVASVCMQGPSMPSYYQMPKPAAPQQPFGPQPRPAGHAPPGAASGPQRDNATGAPSRAAFAHPSNHAQPGQQQQLRPPMGESQSHSLMSVQLLPSLATPTHSRMLVQPVITRRAGDLCWQLNGLYAHRLAGHAGGCSWGLCLVTVTASIAPTYGRFHASQLTVSFAGVLVHRCPKCPGLRTRHCTLYTH